ncbi:hypothetical protein TIFTF001_012379 [Ficus carica]|uniref:Uncharacterized protein n=1 Tax=Ficus carica TaxID=3494 RepID=A0AA88A293_FICCA|nr:hypothetical protein TIFTF001_012379 [Ficus carica]
MGQVLHADSLKGTSGRHLGPIWTAGGAERKESARRGLHESGKLLADACGTAGLDTWWCMVGRAVWLHGWLEWLGLADGLSFWGLSVDFAYNFDSNVLFPYKTN